MPTATATATAAPRHAALFLPLLLLLLGLHATSAAAARAGVAVDAELTSTKPSPVPKKPSVKPPGPGAASPTFPGFGIPGMGGFGIPGMGAGGWGGGYGGPAGGYARGGVVAPAAAAAAAAVRHDSLPPPHGHSWPSPFSPLFATSFPPPPVLRRTSCQGRRRQGFLILSITGLFIRFADGGVRQEDGGRQPRCHLLQVMVLILHGGEGALQADRCAAPCYRA
uniref:Uncharacterized protein n=1 Tax=Zea mays TaxID=4577 RepID=C4IY70_MAIZE|nr:unknown [Zea mays]